MAVFPSSSAATTSNTVTLSNFLFLPARCARRATPTSQLTSTNSRTGPASRPAGLPPGSRTPRDRSYSKASEATAH